MSVEFKPRLRLTRGERKQLRRERRLARRLHQQNHRGQRLPKIARPNFRVPEPTKILVVTGPDWSAAATWTKRNGQWLCSRADKPISWMVNLHPNSALDQIRRKALFYEWHPSVLPVHGEKSEGSG